MIGKFNIFSLYSKNGFIVFHEKNTFITPLILHRHTGQKLIQAVQETQVHICLHGKSNMFESSLKHILQQWIILFKEDILNLL